MCNDESLKFDFRSNPNQDVPIGEDSQAQLPDKGEKLGGMPDPEAPVQEPYSKSFFSLSHLFRYPLISVNNTTLIFYPDFSKVLFLVHQFSCEQC